MDRYSHTYHGETSAALAVLPDLSQPIPHAAEATGTDGKRTDQQPSENLSPRLSLEGGIQANSVESGGVKTENEEEGLGDITRFPLIAAAGRGDAT